jgi:hypothetical protein
MIEVETTLRQGLKTFADETASAVLAPPVGTIKLRAHAAPSRARRWWKPALAIAVGTVVTTSAAAATGVLPGPVESTLREFRSWGFHVNQAAERMASVTDGGITYEVWRAPLDGGGRCVYDRVIGPVGDVEHGGASSCLGDPPSPRSADRFAELHYPERVFDNSTGRDPESAWQHSVSSGQLPVGAIAAVFMFDDGTTLTVPGQREGYFITTFPGVRDGARIVGIRAVSADGRVVVVR